MASFGIGMTIVEPGGARTEFRYGNARVATLMPEVPEETETQPPSVEESAEARVRLTFGENEVIISFVDNVTTRDFVSKLPLTQTFSVFQ